MPPEPPKDRVIYDSSFPGAILFPIAVLLLMLMTLLSCQTEQARISSNLLFSVELNGEGCINSYYLIALVDENDKYEWYEDFNCDTAGGSTHLSVGDLLELRCFTDGVVDKSFKFTYHINYNGYDSTIIADYTGTKYLLK